MRLPVPIPELEIAACQAAHARLRATVEHLAEEDMRRPSVLPGWTVAHALTHLARNAGSIVRRLEGARRGELVPQYEGGSEGRAAEIARDVQRPGAAVLADLLTASASVDDALRDFRDDAWDRPILLGSGEQRPAAHLPASRWREVEVHHVDLGLGYTHEDWDDAFVSRFLPGVMAAVPERADARALLAWGFGRGAAPVLAPWG
jgi:maleylpyruvate isomerase